MPSVFSQLNQEKRKSEEEVEVSRFTGRKRKKIIFKESDDDELDDDVNKDNNADIVRNYSSDLKKAGIDSFVLEQFDSQIRAAHEAFIKQTLAKPFKMPLSGYICSYRPLGTAASNFIRRPLYDPDYPNALILFEPPEMTETERMKTDPDKIKVHVLVDPILARVLRKGFIQSG